jgi:FKBP12-rapamycin complex-associated protein
MWARGEQEKSLNWLQTFSARLAEDLGLDLENPSERVPDVRANSQMNGFIALLARCYLKQGEWEASLMEGWTPVCTYVLLLEADVPSH